MIPTELVLNQLRHILNEYPTGDDNYENETNNALLSFVAEAIRFLSKHVSPVYMGEVSEMKEADNIEYIARPDGMYYGILSLPDDYLSFVSLKIDGWVNSVRTVLPANTPIYEAQFSAAPGIGNGSSMPVVFITNERDKALEAHSIKITKKEGETEEGPGYVLRYISAPNISGRELPISDIVRDALVYVSAAFYLRSRDNQSAYEQCMSIANEQIAIINNK